MKPITLALLLSAACLTTHPVWAQDPATATSGAEPAASAPQPSKAQQNLQAVTVQGSRSAVEKSYRRITEGMDYFDKHRTRLPADRQLYFRFVPLVPGVSMTGAKLRVWTNDWTEVLPIDAQDLFQLPRNPKWERDWAMVSPNRPEGSVTWRAQIRGARYEEGKRRLGDLRMECEVGHRSELISNPHWMRRLVSTFSNLGDCGVEDESLYMRTGYILFAERPLFGVTLKHGDRTWRLPMSWVHGRPGDIGRTDARMLHDRIYFLPLRDACWPDDTEVLLDYVDEARTGPQEWVIQGEVKQLGAEQWRIDEAQGPKSREEALSRWGQTQVLRFGTGHEIWIYGHKSVSEAELLKAEAKAAKAQRKASAADAGASSPEAGLGQGAPARVDVAALAKLPGMKEADLTPAQRDHGHKARGGEWTLLFSPTGELVKQYRVPAEVLRVQNP